MTQRREAGEPEPPGPEAGSPEPQEDRPRAKAVSVDEQGRPDGWVPPVGYRVDVEVHGATRLVVSVPGDRLPAVHDALVAALEGPLSALYVQLTDRPSGHHHGARPLRFVGSGLPVGEVRAAVAEASDLLHLDGRCQFWVRDALGAQVVLDELGLLYVYPDDPAFRGVLDRAGLHRFEGPTLADRPRVRVAFLARADAMEPALLARLGLVPDEG